MKYISIVLLLLVNNIHANNSINQKGGAIEVIGIAKDSSVDGTQVTYDFYLENLGSTTLSNIQISEDLDSVFGFGNFTIISGPALIDNPSTITLNAGFNGSGDSNLITSASLFTLDTAQIRIVVDVTTTIDQGQGQGFGIYSNQVTITSNGLAFNPTDVSDSGTDPDPNGNGDPTEAGENDATITDLSTTPVELLQFEID